MHVSQYVFIDESMYKHTKSFFIFEVGITTVLLNILLEPDKSVKAHTPQIMLEEGHSPQFAFSLSFPATHPSINHLLSD